MSAVTQIKLNVYPASPIVFRNVAMVPLFSRSGSDPNLNRYLPAQTALNEKSLIVTETGTVSRLWVRSQAALPIFVPAGQPFLKGGQDRFSAVSLIIAPGCAGEIPSRCQEQSRWNPRQGDQFIAPDESCLAASEIPTGSSRVSQKRVWDRIAHLDTATNADSPTDSLHDIVIGTRVQRSDYQRVLACPQESDAVGVFFRVINEFDPEHMEPHDVVHTFGSNYLFRELFLSVLNSVTLTAVAAQHASGHYKFDESDAAAAAANALKALKSGELKKERIDINAGELYTRADDRQLIAVLHHNEALVHAKYVCY